MIPAVLAVVFLAAPAIYGLMLWAYWRGVSSGIDTERHAEADRYQGRIIAKARANELAAEADHEAVLDTMDEQMRQARAHGYGVDG